MGYEEVGSVLRGKQTHFPLLLALLTCTCCLTSIGAVDARQLASHNTGRCDGQREAGEALRHRTHIGGQMMVAVRMFQMFLKYPIISYKLRVLPVFCTHGVHGEL